MYVPAQFRQEDVGELKRLMRAHDFATLISTGPDGAPFATHLPLLLEEGISDDGTLFLRSHMARANPQWKHFAAGTEVLAIFHGPHAWSTRTGTILPRTYRHGTMRWSTPTGRRR